MQVHTYCEYKVKLTKNFVTRIEIYVDANCGIVYMNLRGVVFDYVTVTIFPYL